MQGEVDHEFENINSKQNYLYKMQGMKNNNSANIAQQKFQTPHNHKKTTLLSDLDESNPRPNHSENTSSQQNHQRYQHQQYQYN